MVNNRQWSKFVSFCDNLFPEYSLQERLLEIEKKYITKVTHLDQLTESTHVKAQLQLEHKILDLTRREIIFPHLEKYPKQRKYCEGDSNMNPINRMEKALTKGRFNSERQDFMREINATIDPVHIPHIYGGGVPLFFMINMGLLTIPCYQAILELPDYFNSAAFGFALVTTPTILLSAAIGLYREHKKKRIPKHQKYYKMAEGMKNFLDKEIKQQVIGCGPYRTNLSKE